MRINLWEWEKRCNFGELREEWQKWRLFPSRRTDAMQMWIIWLIVAAVFVIIEVPTQMLWALCLAVGAVVAMAASLAGLSFAWQLGLLATGSLIGYLLLMPVWKRWLARHNALRGSESRTGMDALLGRKAIVTEQILPGQIGRARIDGDNWQVEAPGSTGIILPGEEVSVTGYDSIILRVAKE